MSLKLKVGDLDVQCETVQEMFELIRLIQSSKNGQARAERAQGKFEFASSERPKLRAFLGAVMESGNHGVTSSDLKDLLGLADARALGVMVGMLARFLEGTGIDTKRVVIRKRMPDGERRWYGRRRLPDVIGLLEGQT